MNITEEKVDISLLEIADLEQQLEKQLFCTLHPEPRPPKAEYGFGCSPGKVCGYVCATCKEHTELFIESVTTVESFIGPEGTNRFNFICHGCNCITNDISRSVFWRL